SRAVDKWVPAFAGMTLKISSHIALAAVLLGFFLVEDAAGVAKGGLGGGSLAGAAVEAAEFDLDIGDPRCVPAGAAFEDVERGNERPVCLVAALQRIVGETEIMQIVGDEGVGRAEPALVDRGGFLDQRQR